MMHSLPGICLPIFSFNKKNNEFVKYFDSSYPNPIVFCLKAAYSILLAWLIYPHVTPLLPQLLVGTGLDMVDDYCSSHLYICFLAQYTSGWTVSCVYSNGRLVFDGLN
jgi:hypothetical protein